MLSSMIVLDWEMNIKSAEIRLPKKEMIFASKLMHWKFVTLFVRLYLFSIGFRRERLFRNIQIRVI